MSVCTSSLQHMCHIISALATTYYPWNYVTLYANLLTISTVHSSNQSCVSEFADEESAARHAEAHSLAGGEPGKSESQSLGFYCLTQEWVCVRKLWVLLLVPSVSLCQKAWVSTVGPKSKSVTESFGFMLLDLRVSQLSWVRHPMSAAGLKVESGEFKSESFQPYCYAFHFI
jgi:hypothetical protein